MFRCLGVSGRAIVRGRAPLRARTGRSRDQFSWQCGAIPQGGYLLPHSGRRRSAIRRFAPQPETTPARGPRDGTRGPRAGRRLWIRPSR
ncbi:hypothetical protein HMPREF0724_13356 [Prescottella equi ATCC 33707]|uniref:Uncharacterized protein n=1 Tax=Prescottella equi ATCC 33707 TaxID=525370 RepID=E9T3W5_RHOHA|nr:hypothetical protein HMPREF0724_13356 [Prescottella equi ATCC 33707]